MFHQKSHLGASPAAFPIWAAKFCTVCDTFTFFLVVLAHTDEQYNNLLKYERINCSDQRTPIKQVLYAIYLTKATYTF